MQAGGGLHGAAAPAPLLAPTEALLRGFVFDTPAAVPEAVPVRAAGDAPGAILLREGFRIGELRLMIRYQDGNELTDLPQVYLLPRAPAWFRGMANLHGTLVPVFDPAELFGVAHDEKAKPMLLVLGHGDEKAGVVIDGLPQRLRLTESDRIEDAAMPPSLAGCVNHAYWSEGLDWMDLQVDHLLRTLAEELAGTAQ
ncbi:MAG TPA: chemotaxis protein CheW [Ramlibacter sp.]|jgi:purine-binding chemotaxis protein CheW